MKKGKKFRQQSISLSSTGAISRFSRPSIKQFPALSVFVSCDAESMVAGDALTVLMHIYNGDPAEKFDRSISDDTKFL